MVNFLSLHFTGGKSCPSSFMLKISEALNLVRSLATCGGENLGVLTRSVALGNADVSDPSADHIDNRRDANLSLSDTVFL
jgi:hypothetical protein